MFIGHKSRKKDLDSNNNSTSYAWGPTYKMGLWFGVYIVVQGPVSLARNLEC